MNPNCTKFKFPQIKARPWHKVMANSRGNTESVYDMDMLNKDMLEAYQYTIKSLQEDNASLKAEKVQLANESVELFKRTNNLRDQRDKLTTKRNQLKHERKLLRAERNELKVDMAHFRKAGESNRKKLCRLSPILDEE